MSRRLSVERTDLAKVLSALGDAYLKVRKTEKAADMLTRSLQLWHKKYGWDANRVEIAKVSQQLGLVWYEQRKYQEAACIQCKCIRMKRLLHGFEHPKIPKALNNLAVTLLAMGEHK